MKKHTLIFVLSLSIGIIFLTLVSGVEENFKITPFTIYEIVEQCEDGIKNYDETGVDCGGSCGECSGGVTWIWVIVGILVLIGFVVFIEKEKRK